jgi:hypothetical protein
MTGGSGVSTKKTGWGEGEHPKFLKRGGYPLPFSWEATPHNSQRRGRVPSPARRTLHAKNTFWSWKKEGVGSPPPESGEGRGSGTKKIDRGGGVFHFFWRGDYPPCPGAGRTQDHAGGPQKTVPILMDVWGVPLPFCKNGGGEGVDPIKRGGTPHPDLFWEGCGSF